ncbi:hypothetical protein BDW62DRAFT_175299 [Aspergillus aurantiobrunneus]
MGSTISSTLATLPPLEVFILPTPEAYVTLLNIFQYFPLFTVAQWLTSWHPAGKTSKNSPLNLPGRLAWFAMEIVGPINLVYILYNLPARLNIQTLPVPNKLVASLYVLHYANRAVISPFFAAPSMSPIHFFIVASAMAFNWFNSTCLACWLVGYNIDTIPGYYPSSSASITTPETALEDSLARTAGTSLILPATGLVLFLLGMAGNIHAERTLFRLRREQADSKQSQKSKQDPATTTPSCPTSRAPSGDNKNKNKYDKIYVIPPQTGLFTSILYPHYVAEWIEWTGFAVVGTTVFPALSPPSLGLIPDVLSTSTSTTGAATAGGPVVHLAPWLVPAVWVAGKLRVPVLPLPAIVFVVNAVSNMLPHARWGRKWYVEKFGEEKVGGRGAAVPFVSWL